MIDNHDGIRFFYSNKLLVGITRRENYSRLLRAGGVGLSEISKGPVQVKLLITDQMGSVLGFVGQVNKHFAAYTPYGYSDSLSGGSAMIGFNGEYFNASAGAYPLGHGYRYLSPVHRRFHSPDSLSPFQDGGLNSYSYVSGDPINRSDPTGHMMKARPPLAVPQPHRLSRARDLVFKREAVVEKYVKHLLALQDLEGRTPRFFTATPKFPKVGMPDFSSKAAAYNRYVELQSERFRIDRQDRALSVKLAHYERDYTGIQTELALYADDVLTQTSKKIPGLQRSLTETAAQLRSAQDAGLYEQVYRKKYFEWSKP